jgi:NAD(P)H-hydrate epimerase
MRYLFTPDQARAYDAEATERFGVPSLLLMENAARSAFEYIRRLMRRRFGAPSAARPIAAIFCGSGNNGGDGFALARHLSAIAETRVYWTGAREKMSAETRLNFDLLKMHNIPALRIESDIASDSANGIEKENADDNKGQTNKLAREIVERLRAEIERADIAIDALAGVGGSENIRAGSGTALALEALRCADERGNRALRIAIDVPTGLNARSGAAYKDSFRADYTITMATWKTGMALGESAKYCGRILCASIGAPPERVAAHSTTRILEKSDFRAMLPTRSPRATKKDFGSVLIVGGTATMSGAPTLAANACIKAGAGIVRLCAPQIHPATLPEIMAERLPATERGGISFAALPALREAAKRSSVIVLGMGLGAEEETLALARALLTEISDETTVVLDADGLRIARVSDAESDPRLPPSPKGERYILTPHRGEFARLTGEKWDDIAYDDRADALARAWARRLGCVVVLKHTPVVVTDGEISYWNASGNPGMATAGSGDALAGVIGAIAAQCRQSEDWRARGFGLREAAALGAYIHGAAGDEYARRYTQETLTASGIVGFLPEAFAQGGGKEGSAVLRARRQRKR